MALLRVKRRFLQGPGIFVLCPHVWTHGVTIAIGRVKWARRLGISWERAVRRLTHRSEAFDPSTVSRSGKGLRFGKQHNEFLCCFYLLFCANYAHHTN